MAGPARPGLNAQGTRADRARRRLVFCLLSPGKIIDLTKAAIEQLLVEIHINKLKYVKSCVFRLEKTMYWGYEYLSYILHLADHIKRLRFDRMLDAETDGCCTKSQSLSMILAN